MTDYSNIISIAESFGCNYTENESMSEHTTFRIGGPADLFVVPTTVEGLAAVVSACNKEGVYCFILGNGSNVLVSDKGIRGVVVSTAACLNNIELIGAYEIKCGAGVKLSRLSDLACENSLTGAEFAWGIPGTVGGAVYMNAGAYDGEMKDILVSCEYLTPDGELHTMLADEMDLSYRHSAFSENGYVIVSATVRLKAGDKGEIRAKMDDFMHRRKSKQPLEFPSAGSTFKRPVGGFAAALIDECGLKGYSVGGAEVSEKHAGFVINKGGATCFDVMRLVEHIKKEVFLNKSIKLECEIRVIGEK
ncbi:MAG: UDP-N-acetylmuramate dehydrogenase [Clostridia bacterium]|nr:UDP-N-acetylmuramate dehydrogenase [Clostridia bacterium]